MLAGFLGAGGLVGLRGLLTSRLHNGYSPGDPLQPDAWGSAAPVSGGHLQPGRH